MKTYIHPSTIIDNGVTIGVGTKIWHFCHVSKNATIGEYSNLGQNVFIGQNVSIGNNVKIQNNVSVYEGVVIMDDVFCGPSCVFTNDINPRSRYPKNKMYKSTIVYKGATIGANATISCGINIGEYSMIGAGAVVTKTVLPHSIVIGNPAKHYAWVCICGFKIDSLYKCINCDREYEPSIDPITSDQVIKLRQNIE